ncbi:hypothetical protein AsAng_0010040 [Aureispira anguillae]|uniref:Uncharacterized protein n=1 Tax=Aureispira anguillae TaxID=2864201 RepID=A0A916DPR6_9BACT|nr:hypothetical protein AsAng_0010040 [Aureispira anguillae]
MMPINYLKENNFSIRLLIAAVLIFFGLNRRETNKQGLKAVIVLMFIKRNYR